MPDTSPTPYQRLLAETAHARGAFLSIPVLSMAMDGAVPLPLYRDFLAQAYHHVRHTCRLLALAAARTEDEDYRAALFDYIIEEQGHEQWILDDIDAVGGDAAQVAASPPGQACRAMLAYVYDTIERVSPYALLGMVHVLEGMSTLLASRAADALRRAYRTDGASGFRYLTSHGALDQEHVAFFQQLVDGLRTPEALAVIADTANMVYRLYGDIFRDLSRGMDGTQGGACHAA
ncbi:iron-containing redox enzyme family protein [Nitrospirillum sp. BR 11164]|uniref:TenA family transcriptional regulator n=1 Tax=Nitrospirillum sp. BR 11164 TaxID=3104324 RepID=UPI002AFE2624|nr:iron-containing redox enzyme family protein [Nitrospirillum sp. BR 11164]MEA1647970.1 iron-containing redox enzyme family protein [Nitrospirillum sp. BR 11164]